MKKAAIYTGTSNLYGGMIAASKSLIANSDVDEVWFFIEDDKFPVELPDIITTANISEEWKEFYDPHGPNMTSQFTYMAMIRPAFCHLLPHLDRVLSLDVDTMVRTDISDVWNTDLEGYYFAGCNEPHHSRDGVISTNAGVILMNLDMLRDGRADLVIDALNVHWFQFVDQEAMNCLCQGRIQLLDPRYNGTKWCGIEEGKPCFIKHYAGIKNWYHMKEAVDWYRMPWDEVLRRHELVTLKHSDKDLKMPEVYKHASVTKEI